MIERWETKKENRNNRRNNSDRYTFGDVVFDILFWIPELLFLPFRMIFWLGRGVGRVIWNFFDGV